MRWLLVVNAGLLAFSALANISYTCDPTTFAANAPAGACAAIQGSSVAGVYSSIFSSINASIYVQFGNTGVGQSDFNLLPVSYTDYYNALKSVSTDAAVQTLTAADPIAAYGNTDQTIDVSAALGAALGLSGAAGAGIDVTNGHACTLGLGNANCYNGVITLSAQANLFYYPTSPSTPSNNLVDAYGVVEHETDEILGTISCIGSNSTTAFDQCGTSTTDASPADLFRYAALNTPTFLNAVNGSTAYFSVNGGASPATPYSYYINSPGQGDYGDWIYSGAPNVQDGEVSRNYVDLTTDDGSEIQVLNAVGFNLVPEPGTMGLLGLSLAALVAAGTRLRR